jgi:hypothetical protein
LGRELRWWLMRCVSGKKAVRPALHLHYDE